MAKSDSSSLGRSILSKGKAVIADIYRQRQLVIVLLFAVYFLLFTWSVRKHQSETGKVILDKGQCIQVAEPLKVELRM